MAFHFQYLTPFHFRSFIQQELPGLRYVSFPFFHRAVFATGSLRAALPRLTLATAYRLLWVARPPL